MVVENPMVIDQLWLHIEQVPKTVAVCEGCREAILEGDEMFELVGFEGDTVYLHQDSSCTYDYVANASEQKTAAIK
jgi:hypothetical protein